MPDRSTDHPRTPHGREDGESPAQDYYPSSQQRGINLEELAERVYRLMREDLRLDRARRGWD